MTSSGPMSAARPRLAGLAGLAVLAGAALASASLVAPGVMAPASAAAARPTTTKGPVPSVPTGVVAVPGDRSATVSWTNPPGDVRRYKVREVKSGRTKSVPPTDDGSSTTSMTFTGLTNGAPASFVVWAENFAGKGPVSQATSSVLPLPWLYVQGTLLEGGTAARNVVTVRLTQRLEKPLTFRIRTTDTAQALASKDYVAFDTTATIPAGKTAVTLPFTVIDDKVAELTESVTFSITADGARQSPTAASPTIIDDDAGAYLYLDGASTVAEGASGTTPLRFGLRLSKAVDVPVVVRLDAQTVYLVDGGPLTVSARTQLAPPVQVVTIPAGSVSLPVTVGVLGDVVPEPGMHVNVWAQVLSGPVVPAVEYNDGEVTDDDTSTPNGADLAVTLPSLDLWSAQGDGRLAVDVGNGSKVAASGVTVTVGATAVGTADALAAAVTADPACTLVSASTYTHGTMGRVGNLEWSCPLGKIAAYGQSVLHFPVDRAAATQPRIEWSAGVTSSPFSDPRLSNNAVDGTVWLPTAG